MYKIPIKNHKWWKIAFLSLLSVSVLLFFVSTPLINVYGQEGERGNAAIIKEVEKETRLNFVTKDVFGGPWVLKSETPAGDVLSRAINIIIKILFAVAGVTLVVMLTIYGTQLIYAQINGRVDGLVVKKGKIQDIAFGIVLLLLSYLLLSFVNPELLRPKLLFSNDSDRRINFSGSFIPDLQFDECTLQGGKVAFGSLPPTFKHPKEERMVRVSEVKISRVLVSYQATDGTIKSKVSGVNTESVDLESVDRKVSPILYLAVTLDGEEYYGYPRRCKTLRSASPSHSTIDTVS